MGLGVLTYAGAINAKPSKAKSFEIGTDTNFYTVWTLSSWKLIFLENEGGLIVGSLPHKLPH